MPHTDKEWEKLDNTAKLFPVIATERMSATYRISVLLKEDIDPVLLQRALDRLLPLIPTFNRRLRTGFFWYYLEENGEPAPRVYEENDYPCRYIHASKNNSYLFRVSYYKNRINLEGFHVLADGSGGINFLRELVYEYLRLSHPGAFPGDSHGFSEGTSLSVEDSFVSNFKKGQKSPYKSKPAYIVKGDTLAFNGYGLTHIYLSVKELKSLIKEKYGCSINQYLIAAFAYGLYKSNPSKVNKKHPVRIAVPVDLRPYYGSQTTKNFFAIASAEYIPEDTDGSFLECLRAIKTTLDAQVKKEVLDEILNYNVGNEMFLLNRAVPLFVKSLLINAVYIKNALAQSTTITNIGNISFAPEYEDYISSVHCLLSFSKGQDIKATITSFKDELNYTVCSRLKDTTIQKYILRRFSEDGLTVRAETNGVYK